MRLDPAWTIDRVQGQPRLQKMRPCHKNKTQKSPISTRLSWIHRYFCEYKPNKQTNKDWQFVHQLMSQDWGGLSRKLYQRSFHCFGETYERWEKSHLQLWVLGIQMSMLLTCDCDF